MPHPFQATIDLLRNVIHAMPGVFPQERHQVMDGKLNEFERNPDATQEEIESALITYGGEIWPFREAYEEFHRAHGEERERALVREKLSPRAQEAFDRFLGEGGGVEDVRQGAKFESFDTDLRAEIVHAELAAHDAVNAELEGRIAGAGKEEFEGLVESHRKKLAAIREKIAELRALASRSPKWAPEILDKARTFEQGFCYLERAPSVEDVRREIQYYIDIME